MAPPKFRAYGLTGYGKKRGDKEVKLRLNFRSFEKGLAGRWGLAREDPSYARGSDLFSVPFLYAALRRRGTQFWRSIFAVFWGPVSRQPLGAPNPGCFEPRCCNFYLEALFCAHLCPFALFCALLQGGSGTEPEPETGTVRTIYPETESGTGTAGTVFQEPKPEPEPSFPLKMC